MPATQDAFFESIQGPPELAAARLQPLLDARVVAAIDWGALARVPGEFVDEALGASRPHVLFTAPWLDRSLLPARIFVVAEDPLTPDPMLPFRVLQYMVRIWDRFTAEQPQAHKLPAILPIILRDGAAPWTAGATRSGLAGFPSH